MAKTTASAFSAPGEQYYSESGLMSPPFRIRFAACGLGALELEYAIVTAL
jgi:hypothetical protein